MGFRKAARPFVIPLAALALAGAAGPPAAADPIAGFERDAVSAGAHKDVPARLAAGREARGPAAGAVWFATAAGASGRAGGSFFPASPRALATPGGLFHQPSIPGGAADRALAASSETPAPGSTAVPEAGSILMLGTSLLIVAFLVRRRSRHSRR